MRSINGISRLCCRLSVFWLLLVSAGCAFLQGDIEEGMPKLGDKLPETTKVFIACPLKPNGAKLYSRNGQLVADEFAAAFKVRGIAAQLDDRQSGATDDVLKRAKERGCDVVLFTQVLNWNYGDAGFLGSGGREEARLSVMLMKPEPRRVIARANLQVSSGIGNWPFDENKDPREYVAPIVLKYVESLFPEKKDRP